MKVQIICHFTLRYIPTLSCSAVWKGSKPCKLHFLDFLLYWFLIRFGPWKFWEENCGGRSCRKPMVSSPNPPLLMASRAVAVLLLRSQLLLAWAPEAFEQDPHRLALQSQGWDGSAASAHFTSPSYPFQLSQYLCK